MPVIIQENEWSCTCLLRVSTFLSIIKTNSPNLHYKKIYQEQFEDTKGVIRSLNLKEMTKRKRQKDKQRTTKHYTEN